MIPILSVDMPLTKRENFPPWGTTQRRLQPNPSVYIHRAVSGRNSPVVRVSAPLRTVASLFRPERSPCSSLAVTRTPWLILMLPSMKGRSVGSGSGRGQRVWRSWTRSDGSGRPGTCMFACPWLSKKAFPRSETLVTHAPCSL